MLIVLDFDGVRFYRQGQSLSPDQIARWLRWRRPRWIELRHASVRWRLSREQFLEDLARPPARLLDRLRRTHRLACSFQTLGLAPGSDGTAVRRAYLSLARQHHPDRGGSLDTMQQITLAYRTLVLALDAAGA